MVVGSTVCLRRLGDGQRRRQVGFGRFLANRKVTVGRLIAGWSDQTAIAASGRHVLAIQDTSEISFHTTSEHRRGLGEIGKGGRARGLLLHAMLALDANSGACLGLAGGQIWTRRGRVKVAHQKRRADDKESYRWIATAEQGKQTLAAADMVTMVSDRESDIFAVWASVPEETVHLITRSMHDRRLADGSFLYETAAAFPVCGTRTIALPEREHKRTARSAKLSLRFGAVELAHPRRKVERDLPQSVPLTFIEVIEQGPPHGAEPVDWRLLTTHPVSNAKDAWQIVDWYKMRWAIEQFWRLLKLQGLRLEDSQLQTAERLIKLTAIAAKAAVTTFQLLQARDGHSHEPASTAFADHESALLDKLNTHTEGATALQKNPHPKASLAWAAWIIARLGGWDGYPSSKPPGPITFKHGLHQFHTMARAWKIANVCIP
ncbi:MAG: IS4 family transposase [Rhodospirillaceae bacterium]|nr:IS4 family transposase [Rhodospirillaceae bacterium]